MEDGARDDAQRDARLDHSVPYTQVHEYVRRFLEPAQDLLILTLALVLFALMARIIQVLITQVFMPRIAFREVISEVLFMLVLVELLRLLIIYLRDHHVAIDVMVEISIVSVLRETVLLGIVEIAPAQILAIAVFLVVLGLLLRYGTLRQPVPAWRRRDRGAARPGPAALAPGPEGRGIGNP